MSERMGGSPGCVDIHFCYGGKFEFKDGETKYDGEGVHMQCGVCSKLLSVMFLREIGEQLMNGKQFDIWYKRPTLNLTIGKTKVMSEYNIGELLKTKDYMNVVTLYITSQGRQSPLSKTSSSLSKKPDIGLMQDESVAGSQSKGSPIEMKPYLKAHPNLLAQMSIDPLLHKKPYSVTFQNSSQPSPSLNANTQKQPLNLRKSPRQHLTCLPKKTVQSSCEIIGVNSEGSRGKLPVRRQLKLEDKSKMTVRKSASKEKVVVKSKGAEKKTKAGADMRESLNRVVGKVKERGKEKKQNTPVKRKGKTAVSSRKLKAKVNEPKVVKGGSKRKRSKTLISESEEEDAYYNEEEEDSDSSESEGLTDTEGVYAMTYEPAIAPMPGVRQWEKSGLPEPSPPPIRSMPGRPSLKKRKKEPGEKSAGLVKRAKKKNKCGNCGELGHYKRTCKNVAATSQPNGKPGRPQETNEWAKKGRQRAARLKSAKEAYQNQFGSQTSSQGVPNQQQEGATTTPSFTELLTQQSSIMST